MARVFDIKTWPVSQIDHVVDYARDVLLWLFLLPSTLSVESMSGSGGVIQFMLYPHQFSFFTSRWTVICFAFTSEDQRRVVSVVGLNTWNNLPYIRSAFSFNQRLCTLQEFEDCFCSLELDWERLWVAYLGGRMQCGYCLNKWMNEWMNEWTLVCMYMMAVLLETLCSEDNDAFYQVTSCSWSLSRALSYY